MTITLTDHRGRYSSGKLWDSASARHGIAELFARRDCATAALRSASRSAQRSAAASPLLRRRPLWPGRAARPGRFQLYLIVLASITFVATMAAPETAGKPLK